MFPVIRNRNVEEISEEGICYSCTVDRVLEAQVEGRQTDADILLTLLATLGLVQEGNRVN